jgi:hypothetical protein
VNVACFLPLDNFCKHAVIAGHLMCAHTARGLSKARKCCRNTQLFKQAPHNPQNIRTLIDTPGT